MIFFGMPTIWGCVKYRKLGYSSNGKDADKLGDSSNGYPTFRQTQYSLEKDESTRMCDGGGGWIGVLRIPAKILRLFSFWPIHPQR